jgi:hypothetical protein
VHRRPRSTTPFGRTTQPRAPPPHSPTSSPLQPAQPPPGQPHPRLRPMPEEQTRLHQLQLRQHTRPVVRPQEVRPPIQQRPPIRPRTHPTHALHRRHRPLRQFPLRLRRLVDLVARPDSRPAPGSRRRPGSCAHSARSPRRRTPPTIRRAPAPGRGTAAASGPRSAASRSTCASAAVSPAPSTGKRSVSRAVAPDTRLQERLAAAEPGHQRPESGRVPAVEPHASAPAAPLHPRAAAGSACACSTASTRSGLCSASAPRPHDPRPRNAGSLSW